MFRSVGTLTNIPENVVRFGLLGSWYNEYLLHVEFTVWYIKQTNINNWTQLHDDDCLV